MAQETAKAAEEQLIEAATELLTLPPLKDLLRIASNSNPLSRKFDAAKEKEVVREKLWKLANYDVLTFQSVYLAGRRDVFAINTDGSVYVPTASVVDNLNMQGSIALRINPMSFFLNKKQAEISVVEQKRLSAEQESISRDIAEGVIYAYNMAQKSLEMMDARSEALQLVNSRAELAEQMFRNGSMTLSEYAEFQSKASDMDAKFRDAKGDFRLYYQLLMERVYGKLP